MSLLALVGLPNSGKSALFNALTKNRQRVANFPGITVEKKKGKTVYNDQSFEVVDLPGVYTLDAASLDEKVTRDYILNKKKEEKASKKCPSCAELIKKEAKVCKHCGKEIEES